jgi:hypothetical protein
VPKDATRVRDLGSGDGRLLGLLLLACPNARGVALDVSPPMLERLRQLFCRQGDNQEPGGSFDAGHEVSSASAQTP